MEIDFFTMFMAVLLANILSGIIINDLLSYRNRRGFKRRKLPVAIGIPESKEVEQANMDGQMEAVIKSMRRAERKLREEDDLN